MGIRIIEGLADGNVHAECAVLYCSTSMRALPWIFESAEAAEAFLESVTPLYGDVRKLSPEEGDRLFEAFQRARQESESA